MEGVKEADCARRGIICFGVKGKIEQPILPLKELPSYRIWAGDWKSSAKRANWTTAVALLSDFFAKNKNVGKNCFR